MYTEIFDRNRESWKFTYKGKELVEKAYSKVQFYADQEEEFRTRMSLALEDRSISVNSGKINKLKICLANAATQKEICEVFLHEFKRNPDREFTLSLADVVFFGLAGHAISTQTEDDD